jgi:hypothetical protein
MRAEYVATISTAPVSPSLILRRPLQAVVSKDEARADCRDRTMAAAESML